MVREGCVDALFVDVAIDGGPEPFGESVGLGEVVVEVGCEPCPSIGDRREAAHEDDAVMGEPVEVERVTAALAGDVGIALEALLRRVKRRDRPVVEADRVGPPHDVATAVTVRDPTGGAHGQEDAPAGLVELLGDLCPGLAAADDEDGARGNSSEFR